MNLIRIILIPIIFILGMFHNEIVSDVRKRLWPTKRLYNYNQSFFFDDWKNSAIQDLSKSS